MYIWLGLLDYFVLSSFPHLDEYRQVFYCEHMIFHNNMMSFMR